MASTTFTLYFPKHSLLYLFAVLICLFSCKSTATDVTASWKSEETAEEGYDHIFVAVLSQDMETKEIVEGQMVALLESIGVNATTSLSLFPQNFSAEQVENKSLILDEVRAQGNDAILTISLVDQESENRFVAGNDTYAPAIAYGYYQKFHTYYAHNFTQIYTPGYYSLDKIYYLETNLYDVEDEELYWSAQSDTYNPGNIEAFAGDFSKVMVARLKKEGLIRTKD
ncbi:hypothetical protein [Catalinimonas niigatensis]|uniref:hypothetical protein n=1 Tax=Catalinimonas niigatensis TaxID=1397264 RepID=UPI0026668A2E|nr:hypothetical protein [Catalinimonas niigatensis]WPP53541.1 hypothetical protein PZB72_14295 [Catalinimonas niigatensis]